MTIGPNGPGPATLFARAGRSIVGHADLNGLFNSS
jgi:hypothetical protein